MRHLVGLTLLFLVGVALLGACGGACSIDLSLALDIRGASNTACTLTINSSNSVTFDIPAPSPPVPDTSLAPRNPLQGDSTVACAGGVAVEVTPSFATATRTSDNICVETKDLRSLVNALGTNDCTNVTLTLVCAGTTLYDHAPIPCVCRG